MRRPSRREVWFMKRLIRRWAVVFAGIAWIVSVTACVATEEAGAEGVEPPATESPMPQPATPLSAGQLDQLTAPIALYADPLVGMILTAATYPLEVVEATRWLDADEHASLHGDALEAALAEQRWDTSIKALVSTPHVLRMMNQNLEWTEQIGDAFLAQQADVMDSIQRLRQRAVASGALHTSPQATVTNQDGDVVIEPTSPDVLYVPCYAPMIYGPWPWPAYPPYYFPFSPGYCYGAGLITFGLGIGIVGPYWGWGIWNWRGHGFYVVGRRYPHRGAFPMRPWVHNPAHRHGVPYPNAATARRYLGPNARAWRGYRGFPARPARPPRSAPGTRIGRGNRALAPRQAPIQRAPTRPPPRSRAPRAPAPHTPWRGPPAFQSYGPGPRVRSEAQRGAISRSAPVPQGRFSGRSAGSSRGGSRRPR